MEKLARLQSIQEELLEVYCDIINAEDYEKTFLMDRFKELREKEDEVIADLRISKEILEIAQEDSNFHWRQFQLQAPSERLHLFWIRTINLLVDGEFALQVDDENAEFLVAETARIFSIDKEYAKVITKTGLDVQREHFKNFLYQSLIGIKNLIDQEINLQYIEELKTNLFLIMFLYPNFLERELVEAGFILENMMVTYQCVDKLLVKRIKEASENNDLTRIINCSVSFGHLKNEVALDNINAILGSVYLTEGITWEVWKMQLHLVLRMLDEKTRKSKIEELSFLAKMYDFGLIEEVVEEIQGGYRLAWEMGD